MSAIIIQTETDGVRTFSDLGCIEDADESDVITFTEGGFTYAISRGVWDAATDYVADLVVRSLTNSNASVG